MAAGTGDGTEEPAERWGERTGDGTGEPVERWSGREDDSDTSDTSDDSDRRGEWWPGGTAGEPAEQ